MTRAARVVVALHAHPDDESLLTGGTLAALSRQGHRVVLVVATDGERGLTEHADGADVAALRRSELDHAAALLGVARVVRLGYADSGDAGTAEGFCHVPVQRVVERLLAVTDEEDADLLIGYDEHGGYGHPDHRQVHAVAVAAAAQRDFRLLLATVDRTWLSRGLRLAARCGLLPHGVDPDAVESWYSARDVITHRIPVRRQSLIKRRALACHTSQAAGGTSVRTVKLLAGLPRPVFAVVAGTEWFVEPGAAVARRPRRNLFPTTAKDVA